jgi:SMI1/KNR4 family protein SUKH-1
VPEHEIASAERAVGRRFPDDYRQLLLGAGGGSVYGSESRLVMLEVRHLPSFNPDRERYAELSRMLIIGDDEGDFLYFYDPENQLEHGAWGIFSVAMSSASPARAFFVARDLRHLIERILGGEAVIE